MSNENDVDFSLLDGTLEDLADLKGFEPLPEGSYVLDLAWEQKAINDMPAVILKLKVVEVLELADKSITEEAAPKPGEASTDIAFLLKKKDKETGNLVRNELGEGQFKQVLNVLHEAFGGATNRETMSASEGARIAATLKIRVDKKDPDRRYNAIKECSLPE